MKIAVTYDNGNIFQHFGKTENFKVYEVEDNKVVSSEVIGSNGTGHGALAGLLSEQGVDVLICGGIGGGAAYARWPVDAIDRGDPQSAHFMFGSNGRGRDAPEQERRGHDKAGYA